MKTAVKLLLIFSLLAIPFTVSANSLTISELTPEQKAQVEQNVANMKLENIKNGVDVNLPNTAAEVARWANVGKEIGTALAATAKALNTEVNEFAKSPVGIWAIVLITYKVIGADIVGIFFGTFFLLVTIPTWIWMFKKRQYRVEISYEEGEDKKFRKKNVVKFPVGESANNGFPNGGFYFAVQPLLITSLFSKHFLLSNS